MTTAWESRFLGWFATQGIPIIEQRFVLGGFSYHQFATFFETADGRNCSTYGRSQDRNLAALKAAAECIERKVMVEYFMSIMHKNPDGILPPLGLRTSNGWAVYQTKHEAERRAYLEALERHLILKSYLSFGWEGFELVHKIESPEAMIYFLTTRFVTDEQQAGIVVTKSPHYRGVSFGYCVGWRKQVHEMNFWESALFESVDKILALQGQEVDLTHDPDSWLLREMKFYLEAPFCLEDLELGIKKPALETDSPAYHVKSFDLAQEMHLDFPLSAAFVWGGEMIPLFHQPSLSEEARVYLGAILEKNGIRDVPGRHPVL